MVEVQPRKIPRLFQQVLKSPFQGTLRLAIDELPKIEMHKSLCETSSPKPIIIQLQIYPIFDDRTIFPIVLSTYLHHTRSK